jgi:hypothetical protein
LHRKRAISGGKNEYRDNKITRGTAGIVTIILVLYLVLLCTLSCTGGPSPTQSQPEPSATPSPATPEPSEQTTEWQADGIINDREYTGTQDYGDYLIWWTSDNMYAYIGMRAKTEGWVAMALDSGQMMKDADMVMGIVQDGKAAIYDLYSTGNFGPHLPDTELGGSDDILEFAGKEEGGYTIIEFKRKLDTGDKYDHAFTPGNNSILWSFGADDQPDKKHVSRGHGEIDL